MGSIVKSMNSYYERGLNISVNGMSDRVLTLACKSLLPLVKDSDLNGLNHLIVATTCPDHIAPSLGQALKNEFYDIFSNAHVIDIVQGCTGGISAMILASQLAESYKSPVIVVLADAAIATTSDSEMDRYFGNGSFACLMEYEDSPRGLLHHKNTQYLDLLNVVTINLGQDTQHIIRSEKNITVNPRKYVGLKLNNSMAVKLLRKTTRYYEEFVNESYKPDMMVFHQVNPNIINYLKKIFEKKHIDVVDITRLSGNCGAASIGIALDYIKDKTKDKKIFICSFGTGGAITAGLWQF